LFSVKCVYVEQCEEHAEDSVWLVHKTGFTSAVRLRDSNDVTSSLLDSCLMKLSHCNTPVHVKKCDLHQVYLFLWFSNILLIIS